MAIRALVLDAWQEFETPGILSLLVALPGLALLFQPSLSWRGPSSDSTWLPAQPAGRQQWEQYQSRSGENQPVTGQHQGNLSGLEGRCRRQNLKLCLDVRWDDGLKQRFGVNFSTNSNSFAIPNQSDCDVQIRALSVASRTQKGVCA